MRFDVIQRITEFDEETGHIEAFVEPDPLRYEWQEVAGETMLFDRFDKTLIPQALVMKMLRQAVEMPRLHPIAVLADVGSYVDARRIAIAAALDGAPVPADFQDASQELLSSLAGDELAFVVMSLDLVDSSAISRSVDGASLARMLATLLNEVSELVALFHGHVLRYAGDGLVAYFPEPGFITSNDLAVDCALCARRLIYDGLNPELAARKLPTIEVRIGLDAGDAAVVVLGSARTKRHADLIGDVLSLASSIEAAATAGEVLLGETTERNLHVTWRQQCEVAPPPADWPYREEGGVPYRLYRLPVTARRVIEAPPRTA